MPKIKVGKIIIISFIVLIAIVFVGLGGNLVIKAGLPALETGSEINFENRLQALEDNLTAGKISINQYDSLSDILRIQKLHAEALKESNHKPDKMPEWVSQLGISVPKEMKYEQIFSEFTSVDDPDEGFNSVSMVYSGTYETAVAEAARIAKDAQLIIADNLKSKGRPASEISQTSNPGICYLNYSLGDTSNDFLISLEVKPSGRLMIIVTDNKQLTKRLYAYAPLNNRQNSSANLKK